MSPHAAADPLRAALDATIPRSAEEADDLRRLRRLAEGAAPWDRSAPLHLTASALVVHPASGRVLLRWHERQQAWLQVGGHAEVGEDDPLAIAQREGVEETGLADLRPWPDAEHPQIVHVVIVSVPASATEAAHEHGDLRYVLATAQPDRATPEDDRAALRWLTFDDAMALTAEDNLRDTLGRVAELLGDDHGTAPVG